MKAKDLNSPNALSVSMKERSTDTEALRWRQKAVLLMMLPSGEAEGGHGWTPILRHLERKGLMEQRGVSPHDMRRALFCLTEGGREVAEELQQSYLVAGSKWVSRSDGSFRVTFVGMVSAYSRMVRIYLHVRANPGYREWTEDYFFQHFMPEGEMD